MYTYENKIYYSLEVAFKIVFIINKIKYNYYLIPKIVLLYFEQFHLF